MLIKRKFYGVDRTFSVESCPKRSKWTLTFFATWQQDRLPDRSCRLHVPWEIRLGVYEPSASPCARRKIREKSCGDRHSCRWTCGGLDDREPIRRCDFETPWSGKKPTVFALADERYNTCEPKADERRPLCPTHYMPRPPPL